MYEVLLYAYHTFLRKKDNEHKDKIVRFVAEKKEKSRKFCNA